MRNDDELDALADCVSILLDDIRQRKTRPVVDFDETATDRAGASEQQQKAPPSDDGSLSHDCN